MRLAHKNPSTPEHQTQNWATLVKTLDEPFQFREGPVPTPPENCAMLGAEDNGAGKTRLVVVWSDGVKTVIATQP